MSTLFDSVVWMYAGHGYMTQWHEISWTQSTLRKWQYMFIWLVNMGPVPKVKTNWFMKVRLTFIRDCTTIEFYLCTSCSINIEMRFFFFFCFAYSLFTGLHKNNYCNQFSFKCSDRVQMDKSIHIIWTSLLFLSLQWRRKLSRCCRCPCDLVHSACSWKRAYETMTISFRCTLEMGVEFVNVVLCSLMSFRINNNAFMGKEGSHLK